MTAELTGLMSPVMIPIADDGSIDYDMVDKSSAFTVNCGADGVIAAGTAVAQELTSITVQERMELITRTVQAVNGDVPVFAGISHPALDIVDDLTDHALEKGADGLFLMPPWGIPPGHDTTLAYFEHITRRTEVPIVLYNNPTVSIDLPRDTMAEIMKLEGMSYVKESSRDWNKLSWLLDQVHETGQVHVFTTLDVLFQTLQMGGVGATLPPPITAPAKRIIEAYQDGNTEEALQIQVHLSKFPPGNARLNAACKAAMKIAGCDIGGIRPPYPDVSNETYTQIERWMDHHHHLFDGI